MYASCDRATVMTTLYRCLGYTSTGQYTFQILQCFLTTAREHPHQACELLRRPTECCTYSGITWNVWFYVKSLVQSVICDCASARRRRGGVLWSLDWLDLCHVKRPSQFGSTACSSANRWRCDTAACLLDTRQVRGCTRSQLVHRKLAAQQIDTASQDCVNVHQSMGYLNSQHWHSVLMNCTDPRRANINTSHVRRPQAWQVIRWVSIANLFKSIIVGVAPYSHASISNGVT